MTIFKKSLFGFICATTMYAVLPATAQADDAAFTAADRYSRHAYYPPPYYFDRYPYYWYPDHYYFDYHPYVRPTGAWRVFDNEVKRLEKNIDNLKDIADDTSVERLVKQADKAMDNLNDELNYYGIYSPDYLGDLLENVNYHMTALKNGVGGNARVSAAFDTSWALLERVNAAWKNANP